MRDTIQLLLGLQELDQDLYRVKDELRRLPIERDRRQANIDSEKHKLAEVERAHFELRVKLKEIEDMTTSQRQRLRKLENEVASSTDAALIAAYQHEMRTLRRDISEAEEEGLGLVERTDALQADVNRLKQGIATLEENFSEYAANVESEMKVAEAKRAKMDAERSERMGSSLDPSVRTKYEKLLDAREGEAMAMLEGKVCQGCYVAVPNNLYVRLARALELIECPSCNRILYLPNQG